jgi:hypothetical protein
MAVGMTGSDCQKSADNSVGVAESIVEVGLLVRVAEGVRVMETAGGSASICAVGVTGWQATRRNTATNTINKSL